MEKAIYYRQLMGREFGRMLPYCQQMAFLVNCHRSDWAREMSKMQIVTMERVDNTSTGLEFEGPIEVQIQQYAITYLWPILLALGTVSNVLSIIVMYRLSYKLWSVCMYFYVLAISDLYVLYVDCGNTWLHVVSNYLLSISDNILVWTEATCKLYTFLFSFAVQFTSWIGIVILIECVLSFGKSSPDIFLRKREYTRAIIILIGVLLFLLNCHFFWTFGLIKPSRSAEIPFTICTYTREWSDNFRDYIWPLLSKCLSYIVPFIIALIFSVVIAVKLHDEKKRDTSTDEAMDGSQPTDLREIQKIMIIISYMYLLVLTIKSFDGVFSFLIERLEIIADSYQLQISYLVVDTVFKFIHFGFLSGKIIIYVSLSKTIQSELKNINKCLIKCIICRDKKAIKNKEQSLLKAMKA